MQNFNPFLLMFSLTGAVVLISRDRAVAALTGFLYLGWLVHALENDIPDIQLYFIPTYLILCLWMATGLNGVLEAAEDVTGRLRGRWTVIIPGLLSLAALLLPLAGVQNTYAANDMSERYAGRRTIEAVANLTAPDSTVLHHRGPLWYLVLVEERRQDLTLVDPFWHNRDVHYADLVWPGQDDLPKTDRIYGTDDFSGVTAARKAIKNGHVYIMDQGIVGPGKFEEAGFDVVRVKKGILYELVPGKDGLDAEGNTGEAGRGH